MRTWIILLGVSSIVLMALYRRTRKPLFSALIAAIVATITLQAVIRIALGHVDEFWPIAAAVSFAAAFSFSMILMLVWRSIQRRNPQREHDAQR
jgi:hypothetical protein